MPPSRNTVRMDTSPPRVSWAVDVLDLLLVAGAASKERLLSFATAGLSALGAPELLLSLKQEAGGADSAFPRQLLGFFRIAYGGNFVLFTPSAEAGRERGRGRLRRGSSPGRIPRPEASAGGSSRPFSPAQTSPRQTRLSSFRFSDRAFTITSTSACLASLGVSSGSPTYSTKTREDDLSGNRQCSTRSLCLGQNRSRSRIPQRKEQPNEQRQRAGGQLPRGLERARREA